MELLLSSLKLEEELKLRLSLLEADLLDGGVGGVPLEAESMVSLVVCIEKEVY